MLTEYQLLALPDQIQDIFIQMERDIVARIAAHLGTIGELAPSDVHRLDQMRLVGFSMVEIQAEIAAATALARTEVYEIFKKASAIEYASYKPTFDILGRDWVPFNSNRQLQNLVDQFARSTSNTFSNISKSQAIGFSDGKKRFKPLQEYYRKAVDKAVVETRIGKETSDAARKKIVRDLADKGISKVHWDSGYSQRLDSTVRRNVMDGMSELSMSQAELIGEQIGSNGFEISLHPGPRPSHRHIGGAQYSEDEYYKNIKHLLGEPNCYHKAWPIVLGVSPRSYSKKELDEFQRKYDQKKSYEGKEYNEYEALQRQRRYETEIRKQKDRINAFGASNDADRKKIAQARLRQLQKSYRDFSNEMGLHVRPRRV